MGKKGGGGGGGRGKSSKNKHQQQQQQQTNNNNRKDANKRKNNRGHKRFTHDQERAFDQQVQALGGRIVIMASDGNCLYRSLGDQLEGRNERHGQIRTKICDYMEKHVDDFAPFIEDDEKPEDYFPRMRKDGEWGGQPELCAASRCFEVNIVIHQLNAPRLEISYSAKAPTIHLSFHGEAHYNSVRALNDPCNPGEPAMPFLDVTAASAPVASGAGGGGKEEGEEKKKKKKKKKEKEEKEGEVEEKNGKKVEGGVGEDDEVQNEKEAETEKGDGGKEEGEGQPPQPPPESAAAAGGGGDEQEEEGGENKKVGGQCPCGSGKKWRKCCRKAEKQRQRVLDSQSGHDNGNGTGGGGAAASKERKKAGGDEGGGIDGVSKKLEAISL